MRNRNHTEAIVVFKPYKQPRSVVSCNSVFSSENIPKALWLPNWFTKAAVFLWGLRLSAASPSKWSLTANKTPSKDLPIKPSSKKVCSMAMDLLCPRNILMPERRGTFFFFFFIFERFCFFFVVWRAEKRAGSIRAAYLECAMSDRDRHRTTEPFLQVAEFLSASSRLGAILDLPRRFAETQSSRTAFLEGDHSTFSCLPGKHQSLLSTLALSTPGEGLSIKQKEGWILDLLLHPQLLSEPRRSQKQGSKILLYSRKRELASGI
ncbi:hypothetical protein CEXT_506421 [Caerostris extrusa]|uniref:Uncharacterized protein n=1 Tax=Caerostris extrusa TaxID=172846 RepID=A0AAV4QTD5_CAEEX|nr:hypothetical protein CEXT_506421 [Caerostris extrusa]